MFRVRNSRGLLACTMNERTILVVLALAVALGTPIAASAATQAELQSQVISLFTQIFEMQKRVITALEGKVSELEADLSSAQTQLTSARAELQVCEGEKTGTSVIPTAHTCAVVNPPACSTSLSATRDSYNCVTGYQCAPAATTTTQPVQPTLQSTDGSCVAYNTVYTNGSTIWCSIKPSPVFPCPITELFGPYDFSSWTCSNSQWVPA